MVLHFCSGWWRFNGMAIGVALEKYLWAFMNPSKGTLRLFSDKIPDSAKNLWQSPNILLQKFPAEEFRVTTKLIFNPNSKLENEETGLTVMGFSYATIGLKSRKDGIYLKYGLCKDAEHGKAENEIMI